MEGYWRNGETHGRGRIICGDDENLGNILQGEFNQSKDEFDGVHCYADGTKTKGFWKNNMKTGWHIFYYADGTQEQRLYENDELIKTKN
mmetsp:Transcript_17446/g.20263  ORF Transcript_17446/g.20263 Transcript_17446/m.20263 type:complete len:89 (+) Transcript_17446:366-632(+)